MAEDSGANVADMGDDPTKAASWYSDAQMLVLRTSDGMRLIPYTCEFSYHARADLEETWGFAEVLERQYRFPPELEGYRTQVYAKYPSQIARPDDHGAVCPRVKHFSSSQAGSPHWKIELATYADQVGTNMYPDEIFTPPIRLNDDDKDILSVREFDQVAAGSAARLPPFDRSRLSNTIGVAVGISARRDDGREVLLWRRRSKKVRVCPGRPGMPLSFALNLPHRDWHGSQSIRDLVFADYNAERAEELGVEQHLFSTLVPVAFCRELARAGKPQFFLEKRAWRTFEQLRAEVVRDSPEWIGDLEAMDIDGFPPEDACPEFLAYLALKRGHTSGPTSTATG